MDCFDLSLFHGYVNHMHQRICFLEALKREREEDEINDGDSEGISDICTRMQRVQPSDWELVSGSHLTGKNKDYLEKFATAFYRVIQRDIEKYLKLIPYELNRMNVQVGPSNVAFSVRLRGDTLEFKNFMIKDLPINKCSMQIKLLTTEVLFTVEMKLLKIVNVYRYIGT